MIKCSICGKEFGSKRAMHGHLVRVHYDEYKAVGCRQEQLTAGQAAQLMGGNRPVGFRLLDKRQPKELAAYNEGYRYIDGDNIVYDAAEVAAEGWV